MSRRVGIVSLLGALSLSACTPEGAPVAGNCEEGMQCARTGQALSFDKLDILLVVDNTKSVSDKLEQFKHELPNMLNGFVNGTDPDAGEFPPMDSVHVAVVSTDMGLGKAPGGPELVPPAFMCTDAGDDGLFYPYDDETLANCSTSHPTYLAFEAGGAPATTVDTVACVPSLGGDGCGYEQPLEAALKALWPSADTSVTFSHGSGHGDQDNAGFLRDDSLLVVVVVTDEDDCSTPTPEPLAYPGSGEYELIPPNLRCANFEDDLYGIERYVDGLKNLRPYEDDVLFVLVAGVPQDLIGDGVPQDGSTDAYFDGLLDASALQWTLARTGDLLSSSCVASAATPVNGVQPYAIPPRRLLKTAKAFGNNAVLGSICSEGFGAETGAIMRAVAKRLRDAQAAAEAQASE